MAKKRTRHTPELKLEELKDADRALSAAADENLIDLDPQSELASATAVAAEEVGDTISTLAVSADFLAARDELKARLGGMDAMMAVASRSASGEQSGLENVVGVGVGLKESTGGFTGEIAVRVYVREKLPISGVESSSVIPESVGGLATDVVDVGEFVAFSYAREYPRPVPCGVSCGHVQITAGTIGAVVALNNSKRCFLSNNHVLANENSANIGDPIIQPGTADGGRMPAHRIGLLERFVKLDYRGGTNFVDAAVAWTAASLVKPQHVTFSLNPIPLSPALQMTVLKNGRTTQATTGVITDVNADMVRVGYGRGVALFDDQIIIQGIGSRPFSLGGDSGSLIVSAGSKQPVALLFAGPRDGRYTIASPISTVMRELGITRFIGG